MSAEPLTLEAATVIRIAGPGLETPYVLAVARGPEGLVLGRIDGLDEALPVGATVRRAGDADGVVTFAVVDPTTATPTPN
jgi:uncharacterized OB-fold protein